MKYPNARRRMNKCRGYMMLDLMIVMTLTIMLLSMCSIWIHKTMLYASTISQRASHTQNISRLSRQLRIDTMLANSIDIKNETISINRLENGVVQFTIDSNAVIRKSTQNEATQVDKFTFAKNAKLTWNHSEWPSWMLLDIHRDFSALSVDKRASESRLDSQIRIGVSQKGQP